MNTNDESGKASYSRRRFLAGLGAGAAAVAGGGVLVPREASAAPHRAHTYSLASSNNFTRLFSELPPFANQSPKVEAALEELGKPGGALDAMDQLSAGPVRLITDPELSVNNPNNPAHTAGTTFFGQFIDHDITFDVGSKMGRPTEPKDAGNGRTAALDLDSVYGGGPVASPQLYDAVDRAKLKVESGGLFEDLPRASDMGAILGDPRNDEHVIIAGLHCAFLEFHNHAVDALRLDGHPEAEVFAEARRLTTWHYQWLVVHEFLPLVVGQALVDDVLANGRRFYLPQMGSALIPVEFQAACYRFGHSMVRPSYRANLAGDDGQAFFGMIFDPAAEGQADPLDLRGGARAPRRFVGWQTFFDFGDGEVKPNKRIDTKLSTPLFELPLAAIASHDQPTALPQRTLLRHLTWKLPSGQDIARPMGAPVLSSEDLSELKSLGVGFERSTPLWYYTLKEAELIEQGLRLGPIGGRIVAEVLIGLLQSDPASFLASQPNWQPTLQNPGSGFRMVDFLRFAGVDPASRGQ
ncbi:MAG TPA: heme peroxidase family protein [Gaiellaceae bacterium]